MAMPTPVSAHKCQGLRQHTGKMRVVNLGVPNIPIEAASIAEQDDFAD